LSARPSTPKDARSLHARLAWIPCNDALLEKYAQDILDTEPPSASASDTEFRAWRAHARERVGTAIGEIRRDDEPDRKQIARQLADLLDRERIWGRGATTETGGRSSKRPR
jgi:hypothetical protein